LLRRCRVFMANAMGGNVMCRVVMRLRPRRGEAMAMMECVVCQWKALAVRECSARS
jgi:hypothetical protein